MSLRVSDNDDELGILVNQFRRSFSPRNHDEDVIPLVLNLFGRTTLHKSTYAVIETFVVGKMKCVVFSSNSEQIYITIYCISAELYHVLPVP